MEILTVTLINTAWSKAKVFASFKNLKPTGNVSVHFRTSAGE